MLARYVLSTLHDCKCIEGQLEVFTDRMTGPTNGQQILVICIKKRLDLIAERAI